jgi:uncharacterized membrane protein YraQ (UPF0718 family)
MAGFSTYLLGAIVAPVVGPFLYAAVERRQSAHRFLDGFVVVAVPGLVLLHVLSFAAAERSVLPIAVLAVGILLPLALERLRGALSSRVDSFALILGLSGLALHALLEGAALYPAAETGDLPFALAVLLHRLPVGLAIWWLVRPAYGLAAAVAALGGLVAITVGGYVASGELMAGISVRGVELYQAFVGGTLIHVVAHRMHHHLHSGERPRHRAAEGMGALVAIGLLVLLESGYAAAGAGRAGSFTDRFLAIALESAPALLIAYAAAGLLTAFLPAASIRWMARGGSFSSALKGMVVGLPLPICSCGVIPIYRTLVVRGAPAAAAMAFLVATPELGLDAILLSVPLLGVPMTVIRVVAAGAGALLVGGLMGRMLRGQKANTDIETCGCGAGDDGCGAEKLDEERIFVNPSDPRGAAATIRAGVDASVDHTAPWILLGLAIAAAVEPFLVGGWLATIPRGLEVPLWALLGIPTYVCASSATPLVAALMAGGMSPGAAIAFLLTGPATNTTTFGLLAGMHGRQAAIRFSLILIGFAVTFGYAVNAFIPGLPVPTFDALMGDDPSTIQVVSLVGLTILFVSSVLRLGIRRFLAELRIGREPRADAHA